MGLGSKQAISECPVVTKGYILERNQNSRTCQDDAGAFNFSCSNLSQRRPFRTAFMHEYMRARGGKCSACHRTWAPTRQPMTPAGMLASSACSRPSHEALWIRIAEIFRGGIAGIVRSCRMKAHCSGSVTTARSCGIEPLPFKLHSGKGEMQERSSACDTYET